MDNQHEVFTELLVGDTAQWTTRPESSGESTRNLRHGTGDLSVTGSEICPFLTTVHIIGTLLFGA